MKESKGDDWMPKGNPRTSEDKVRDLQEKLHRSAKRDKRQKRGPGYAHYPTAKLYRAYGLYRLPTRRPGAPAQASG
jgi:hypothetical protein